MSDLYIEARLQAIKDIASNCCTDEKDYANIDLLCDEIHFEYISETKSSWIPITYEKATEEEKEEYANLYGLEKEDIDMTYDCVLPEDGEEVLITTKYGNVEKTTFYADDCCYFEDYEDCDDVLAWMPLPKPYKDGGS